MLMTGMMTIIKTTMVTTTQTVMILIMTTRKLKITVMPIMMMRLLTRMMIAYRTLCGMLVIYLPSTYLPRYNGERQRERDRDIQSSGIAL